MAKKTVLVDKKNEFTLRALAVKSGLTQEEYLSKVVGEHLGKNETSALAAFETHLRIQEKEIKDRLKNPVQKNENKKEIEVENENFK